MTEEPTKSPPEAPEAPTGCPLAGTQAQPAPHFTETIPSQPGHISGMASAMAPMIYFEGAPFASIAEGVGRITLTATREIAPTADGKGVAQDFVVTAHLRCSVMSLVRLRKTIDDVLLHAGTPEGLPN